MAKDSKFGKIADEINELRAVWPNRLEINLAVLQEAAAWTQAEWRLIATQLVPLIDEELGPQKGEEPRILTKKIWEQVRKRWQQRRWQRGA